jgi:hypothetical protein
MDNNNRLSRHHDRQRPETKSFGFHKLMKLSTTEPHEILVFLQAQNESYENFINSEPTPDNMVLFFRSLASMTECLFDSLKVQTVQRAFESRLFDCLKSYLESLPDVRLSKKASNSLFWKDTESFFRDLCDLCETMIRAETCIRRVADLIFLTKETIVRLRINQEEVYDASFLSYVDGFECRMIFLCGDASRCGFTISEFLVTDLTFRNAKILPELKELTDASKELQLRANIPVGKYEDVTHYLGIQFELLREDFLSPLREGIIQYLQDTTRNSYDNVE